VFDHACQNRRAASSLSLTTLDTFGRPGHASHVPW